MEFVKIKPTQEQSGIDDNLQITKNVVFNIDFNHEINNDTLTTHWSLLINDGFGNAAYVKTHSFFKMKNNDTENADAILIVIIESTYDEFYKRYKREAIISSRYISVSSYLGNDLVQQLLLRLKKSLL